MIWQRTWKPVQRVLKFALPGGRVANVKRGATFNQRPIRSERGSQELPELHVRHAVASDLQLMFGVAIVTNVVRRVREYQVRSLAMHESFNIRCRSSVSHEEFMAPQDPEVAGNR